MHFYFAKCYLLPRNTSQANSYIRDKIIFEMWWFSGIDYSLPITLLISLPPAVSLRRRESLSSILDTEKDTPTSEQGPGQCDKGTPLSDIKGIWHISYVSKNWHLIYDYEDSDLGFVVPKITTNGAQSEDISCLVIFQLFQLFIAVVYLWSGTLCMYFLHVFIINVCVCSRLIRFIHLIYHLYVGYFARVFQFSYIFIIWLIVLIYDTFVWTLVKHTQLVSFACHCLALENLNISVISIFHFKSFIFIILYLIHLFYEVNFLFVWKIQMWRGYWFSCIA